MIPSFSLWFPVFFGFIALKWCQILTGSFFMILSFKLKLFCYTHTPPPPPPPTHTQRFFRWYSLSLCGSQCFLVPSHWNGVNTLTGSFSIILSYIKNDIWLRKKKKNFRWYPLPLCDFLCFLVPLHINSVNSRTGSFPWFGNLDWK